MKDISPWQAGLALGVIWLLITSTIYVGSIFAYSPAFREIAGLPNPLSKIQQIGKVEEEIKFSQSAYLATFERIALENQRLQELSTSQAVESAPALVAARSIRNARPAWNTVLSDIDASIKKIVQSNDIVQKIVLGTIAFNTEPVQGTLSQTKIYSNGEQSSLSLASDFLKVLEESPGLKEVQSSNPSIAQETSSGAVLSYIPLDITFTPQQAAEVSGADKNTSIKSVQTNIQSFFQK